MEDNHYRAMRVKILASMLLVPLIPFVLAGAVGFYFFTRSIETGTIQAMERIVEDHGRMIENFLAERKGDLQFVAGSYGFESLADPAVLVQVFQKLQEKSPAFVDLGVFDAEGLHVAYQGPYNLAGKNYRDAPWFSEVRLKGFYISDIFLGFRNVPHFVIAIARESGGQTWVVRATIDTQVFTDVVEEVRLGRTGEAYIINETGVFQTRRRSGGDLMQTDPDADDLLFAPAGKNYVLREEWRGEKYLYVFTWLKNHKWLLVSRQSERDAFAALYHAQILVLLIAFMGGLLIVFSAVYVTGRIVSRIRKTDAERGRLNEQLVMAGRLAEIGEMSSGFAHEINNPLQIIRAETALMESVMPEIKKSLSGQAGEELADLCDSLNQVQVQVDRCAEITSSILKFARHKDVVPVAVELGDFLPEILRMVEKKAEVEGVALVRNVPPGAFTVRADQSQLQQVVINLINNALHAVTSLHHGTGKGRIAVSLRRADGRAEIVVEDNGCGVSPENLEKIFTPFFSTKPVGQGTGLGLSICFGIIEAMGGKIRVQSQVNEGTTFTVSLPLAEGEE